MKERPIPLKAWEVQAILAGRKTQMRRMVKPQPDAGPNGVMVHLGADTWGLHDGCMSGEWRCPYGKPGDREWQRGTMPGTGWYYVRGLLGQSLGGDDRAVWVDPASFTWGFTPKDDPEAIQLDTTITPENIEWKRPGDRLWVREKWKYVDWDEEGSPKIQYAADDSLAWPKVSEEWSDRVWDTWTKLSERDNFNIDDRAADRRWRSSTNLPRWASRILLEVVSVRVERVQSITEADARDEGITDGGCLNCGQSEPCNCDNPQPSARDCFVHLWKSINGDGSWVANPWVWVVTFKRIEEAK